MRVVVIGGLGNFGARIVKRLTGEPGIELIATSRRPFPAAVSGQFHVAALDIDSAHIAADLERLAPDLVIHCAGPFQGQDYRIALASLKCGSHYIDIADGRDFVRGFVGAVDPAAKAAGRFAITGASTLPALSSAVVDSLTPSFASLGAIDIVIAPGQHAPRGAATVAAVLGYAGQSFPWWRDGAWRTAYGWQGLKRVRFSFGARWAAACDVPDLALLPVRYPGVQTVTFRAALEVSVQHYALWLMAAARRMGLALPLARWGMAFDRIGIWLNWLGSDTGGMTVHVVGSGNAGERVSKTWELVAASNHGPEIPCMATILLAIKFNRGETFLPGAQVCMGILGLRDFEPEFVRWSISTRITDSTP
jgi:saccharopine dehydrogenase-like NADP-dependent oxidoreductase